MIFSKLNVDPIEGAEIMNLLGVYANDIRDPRVFNKVRDIIGFFQGKSDKRYILTKLLAGKPGLNAVDHVWTYCEVRSQYADALKETDNIKEELRGYETMNLEDEYIKSQYEDKKIEYDAGIQKVNELKDQLKYYE